MGCGVAMRVGNLIRWNTAVHGRWVDTRTGVGPCLIVALKNYDWGVNSGNRFHLLVGEEIVLLREDYVQKCYEVIS